MYLSRMTISRDPGVEALKALIDPKNRAEALDAHHRLVWSAFAGDPEKERDFLWRHAGDGKFFVYSAEQPKETPFFSSIETVPFNPDLKAGDQIAFTMRVNATRSAPYDPNDKAPSGKHRRRKVDIVMHEIRNSRDRNADRMPAARKSAAEWMERQGDQKGFAVTDLDVQDYSVMALPGHRGRRKGQPQFGILDLSGEIEVRDPDLFKAALAQGFGRAKSFGCGMMLIQRA